MDEVHERDLQIDLVLSILRSATRARKAAGKLCPKILLMSATIDPSKFLDYMTGPADDGTILTTGYLDLEGRHAEIECRFLPEILQELNDSSMLQFVSSRPDHSSRSFIRCEMQFAAQQAKAVPSPNDSWANDQQPSSGPGKDDEVVDQPGQFRVGLAATVIAHIAATKPKGDIRE